MAKYDYFISYSSKDKDIAYKILNAIESTGHTCWIAPRNIPYGTPYARAIMEGIDECLTFIVLITDNSIKSDDVLNEIDNAHASKKRIIPVRLTQTQLPRELNYYLSRTQWLNLDPSNYESIIDSLKLKTRKKENHRNIPNDPIHNRVTNSTHNRVKDALHNKDFNDAESLYKTGFYYYWGSNGYLKDYKRAEEWFEKAAKKGHALAMFHLGSMYENGEGVKKDYSKAFRWYTQAVDKGGAEAENSLGCCYFFGNGVEKDLNKAVELYRKASIKNNSYAQRNLGICYHYGYGVEIRLSSAAYWYRLAINNGNRDAKEDLKKIPKEFID